MKYQRFIELLFYIITLPIFFVLGILVGLYIFVMFWSSAFYETWKMRNKLYYWEEETGSNKTTASQSNTPTSPKSE